MDGKIDSDVIEERRTEIADLAEELVAQRAEERIGERTRMLVESEEDGWLIGRAEHQGPEVDGSVRLTGRRPDTGHGGRRSDLRAVSQGDLIDVMITGSEGVDLIAEPLTLAEVARP
jgi:tRNA A37 methylthiotransferase MiaB